MIKPLYGLRISIIFHYAGLQQKNGFAKVKMASEYKGKIRHFRST
jgi:hypothetical protein